MSVNISFLTQNYFYFDKPVPYRVNHGAILINPISVISSEVFLNSFDILTIDKNVIPDPKIIQMSYLEFLCVVLFSEEENVEKFINILNLCLGVESPMIKWTEDKKPLIFDEKSKIEINHIQFEDIKQIILYQNFINYDDEYINPDLKKAMDEVDELKYKNIEPINIERKIAIITSHTGLSKKEQLEMSYRSHTALFEEVYGEVEYNALKSVATFGGKGEEVQWIYKKKQGKFDNYVKSVESYNKDMGGNQSIKQLNIENGLSTSYTKFYENFK